MSWGAGKYILLGLGIAVVIAAIAGGVMVLGSPTKERQRRMDEKRVEELAAIGRAADLYRSRHGKLPPGLGEMEQETGQVLRTHDPATQRPYEYRVLDPEKYEICATFQQDSTRGGSWPREFWSHGAGRQCSVLDVQRVSR